MSSSGRIRQVIRVGVPLSGRDNGERKLQIPFLVGLLSTFPCILTDLYLVNIKLIESKWSSAQISQEIQEEIAIRTFFLIHCLIQYYFD